MIRLTERQFTRMVDEAMTAMDKHHPSGKEEGNRIVIACSCFRDFSGLEDYGRHQVEQALEAALAEIATVDR